MVYAPNKGQNINIMFAPAALINIQIPSGLFLYLNATYAPNSKPKPSRHLSYGYACCAHQYTNTQRTLLSLFLLLITERNIYSKHQTKNIESPVVWLRLLRLSIYKYALDFASSSSSFYNSTQYILKTPNPKVQTWETVWWLENSSSHSSCFLLYAFV